MATAAAATKLKLYGIPLSQPFRAVAWTLLQRHVPFEVVVTVPGIDASKPFSTKHVSFVNKTKGKTTTVPVLEVITTDGGDSSSSSSSFCFSESPAILQYLCETRGWNKQSGNENNNNNDDNDSGDLYAPAGTRRKALIDSYMHWHHNGTRNLLALTVEYLRPDITVNDDQLRQAQETLAKLEEGWLSGDSSSSASNDSSGIMIAGGTAPSIADFLCYEEVVQATMTGLLPTEPYPKLQTWMQHMEKLPYHAEAHAALTSLGKLVQDDGVTPIDEPANMRKRLSTATKAGLTAIQTLQQSYSSKL